MSKETINPGYFSHELLHILLFRKGVNTSQFLHPSIWKEVLIRRMLRRETIDHIGNLLDHLKMLPIFLKMGFAWQDFSSDAPEEKITMCDASAIRDGLFVGTKYNAYVVESFIEKSFAAAASPDKHFDYSPRLEILSNAEPELSEIIRHFIVNWQAFELDLDEAANNYKSIIGNFLSELEVWASARDFINRVR